MSFLQRAKEKAAELGSATKRQTIRGKLEIDVRRIEGKISDEKDRIGHALFPSLQDGSLKTEVAEVQEHLDAIAAFQQGLDAKRKEIDDLKDDRDLTPEEEKAAEAEAAAASG
ncbi:MAG: hypothetical protein AB7O57_24045, partial [Hyphomicrobiaceae bacterium]